MGYAWRLSITNPWKVSFKKHKCSSYLLCDWWLKDLRRGLILDVWSEPKLVVWNSNVFIGEQKWSSSKSAGCELVVRIIPGKENSKLWFFRDKCDDEWKYIRGFLRTDEEYKR